MYYIYTMKMTKVQLKSIQDKKRIAKAMKVDAIKVGKYLEKAQTTLFTEPFKTQLEAEKVVGGLSRTEKMPCPSLSLPAESCKMGMKMRNTPGTVCSKCYALKGCYVFERSKVALQRRLMLLEHPQWVDAMVFICKDRKYFRWHDSGDLQSVSHLKMIAEVARRTPNTLHWLPTREYQMVAQFIQEDTVPDNLIIRLSANKIDGVPPVALAKKLGVCVAGVSKVEWDCRAYDNDGQCGECRRCWNSNEFCVTYKYHQKDTLTKIRKEKALCS